MIYNPEPTVTIDGVSYTGRTVNSVSISSGRASVDEQPRASYTTIELLQLDETPVVVDLGARVQVTIEDSSAVSQPVFTGSVTDIQYQLVHGNAGELTRISISCVGPLAWMSRFASDPSYAKEHDGTRIENILASVFAESWDEVNPATIWSAVTAGVDWAHYDPSGYVGTVETPGDYELTNYTSGKVEALGLAAQAANSALGVLYESADGYINYYSATARADKVAADGFLDIPANYVLGSGLSSSISTANLVNDWTISYGNGSSVTATNGYSTDAYGFYAGSRDTQLEKVADANQQLDLLLATRSWPRQTLSAVAIPLHNPNLPDATRNALIGVYCGLPVQLTGLPSTIRNTPFAGFVEGHTWQITRSTVDLIITVSDYGLTQIQQNWSQVNAAELWNTLSLTLDWENARSVA